MKHEVFFLTSIFLCIYRWFSQWRHQILKSKSLGLLNFCVYYVEDDLEINIFRSYQFHNVFRFENTAFWIYELSPCVTPRYKPVWFKKYISLYDSPSLNVSSISGDVFVHICTISRVKSKRFHRKVNSRCFVDFRPPYLWTKSGPLTWRFHTKLYKVACHASANNSETMYQTDVRPGEVAYVLVFYNIFMFLAFFIERLRIYFFMAWQWKRSININSATLKSVRAMIRNLNSPIYILVMLCKYGYYVQ